MPTVADALAALDRIAPPHLALGSDPRGLLLGNPAGDASVMVVALDITERVVARAKALGAGLAIAHHPLIYQPLKSIRADDPFPGPVALSCAAVGLSVACAHTNWDVAPGGVNDVLAELLGLTETRLLRITHRDRLVKVTVFVPESHRVSVLDAMAAAGAGALGDYDRCAFWTDGTGTFRALDGARPFVGVIGEAARVTESRLETIAPEVDAPRVVAALRAAHPYEEVAYDLVPLSNTGREFGIGRIGRLAAPVTAREFRGRIAAALDFDAVRVGGPPERRLETVAVCGGAGAELMADARRLGADALVTSDVRHHEFVDADAGGFTLIDAGHAATENPGARALAVRLQAELPDAAVHFVDSDGFWPGLGKV